MSPPVSTVRLRQPLLFALKGPLAERLGVVLAGIPRSPGVYRFFGEDDRLLYIGQSVNLQARIGSYRFVTAERHSRRLARLVARVRRVEWEPCESGAAAIALESMLLLEHRPPFNRAGVWIPPPWWVTFEESEDRLHARLSREEPTEPPAFWAGPFPSAFRGIFTALLRCTYRWHWREVPWWDLPRGMAAPVIPPHQSFPLSTRSAVSAGSLRHFVTTGSLEFLETLQEAMPDSTTSPTAGVLWEADMEILRKFSEKWNQHFPPD